MFTASVASFKAGSYPSASSLLFSVTLDCVPLAVLPDSRQGFPEAWYEGTFLRTKFVLITDIPQTAPHSVLLGSDSLPSPFALEEGSWVYLCCTLIWRGLDSFLGPNLLCFCGPPVRLTAFSRPWDFIPIILPQMLQHRLDKCFHNKNIVENFPCLPWFSFSLIFWPNNSSLCHTRTLPAFLKKVKNIYLATLVFFFLPVGELTKITPLLLPKAGVFLRFWRNPDFSLSQT